MEASYPTQAVPTPEEIAAAEEAYERAAADGLCDLGAQELAQEAIRAVTLDVNAKQDASSSKT